MSSLNINNVGKPICKIKGGKYDNKIVCVSASSSSDDGLFKEFKQLKLEDKDAKFEPIPIVEDGNERSIITAGGPSGSGKTTYIKMFLRNYINKYPTNNIFMFSKVLGDKSLSDIPNIKYIVIDERLITEPFDVVDFQNSCVIFDDIDTIKNKVIKNAINQLKNEILECGRHYKTSACLTSHIMTKGNETKTMLNESQSITLFLGSGMPIDYLLNHYMGLDTKQIKRLKEVCSESRWFTIIKSYPMILFTEKLIMFLKDL